MSSWHDLMNSCIDRTLQWKHCKTLPRHPVVITLWFSITVLRFFSYLPSLSSYSWLLRGTKVFRIVYLFPSLFNPFFTTFWCCFCCRLFCFLFGLIFFSFMDDFQWPGFICSSFYDFIKAVAEILLSGYFLVIKDEELYKLLLTILEL